MVSFFIPKIDYFLRQHFFSSGTFKKKKLISITHSGQNLSPVNSSTAFHFCSPATLHCMPICFHPNYSIEAQICLCHPLYLIQTAICLSDSQTCVEIQSASKSFNRIVYFSTLSHHLWASQLHTWQLTSINSCLFLTHIILWQFTS